MILDLLLLQMVYFNWCERGLDNLSSNILDLWHSSDTYEPDGKRSQQVFQITNSRNFLSTVAYSLLFRIQNETNDIPNDIYNTDSK